MAGLNSESVEIVFFFFLVLHSVGLRIQPLNSKTPKKLNTNSLAL